MINYDNVNCLTDNFFDNKLDEKHLGYLNKMKQKMNDYLLSNLNEKQSKRNILFKYAMKHKKTFLKLCQLGDIPFDIIDEFIFGGRAAVWNALGSVIPGIDTFTNEIIDKKLVLVKYVKNGQMYGMYASPENSEQIRKCLQNVSKVPYENGLSTTVLLRTNPYQGYLRLNRGDMTNSICIYPINYYHKNCQVVMCCDGDTAATNQKSTLNNIFENINDNQIKLLCEASSKANVYTTYAINDLSRENLNKITNIDIKMDDIPTNFGSKKIDKVMDIFKNGKFRNINVNININSNETILSPMHSPLGGYRIKKRFIEDQENIDKNKKLTYKSNPFGCYIYDEEQYTGTRRNRRNISNYRRNISNYNNAIIHNNNQQNGIS